MNLYLISQSSNYNYDTYDCAVVCAENEDEAKDTHPSGNKSVDWLLVKPERYSTWCASRSEVKVQLIGKAGDDIPAGVVCSSFNAG